jgi:hypothetical protein
MTNAERIARWRKRHANKLARKAARRPSQHHLPIAMPTRPLTIRQAVFPNNHWQGRWLQSSHQILSNKISE